MDERTRDGRSLYEWHLSSGEPMVEDEVRTVVEDGVAAWEDWDDVGGGLYRHVSLSDE